MQTSMGVKKFGVSLIENKTIVCHGKRCLYDC